MDMFEAWGPAIRKESSASPSAFDSAFSTQECGPSLELFNEGNCEHASLRYINQEIQSTGPGRPGNGKDCYASCTSSSTDLAAQQKEQLWHPDDDALEVDTCRDSAEPADQDQPIRPSSSRQQPREQRLLHQQEELLTMIRGQRALEQELCPGGCFLEHDGNEAGDSITPQMRMIVTSWLSEVACEFNMQQETLFSAVALLDRFMHASTGIPRGVLQLVAVACMLLASKLDEVVHPSVEELTDIAANCFQTQDLLRMERILLDSLSWRIKTPTSYTFLHLYTQATAAVRARPATTWPAEVLRDQQLQQQQCSRQEQWQQAGSFGGSCEPLQGIVVAQAAYLVELALLDYHCLEYKPSKVAAAALLLAQMWSEQGAATQELQYITGYGVGDLQPCMGRLVHLHKCAASADGDSHHLAPFAFVKEKYSQDCWLGASLQQPGNITEVARDAASSAPASQPVLPAGVAAAASAFVAGPAAGPADDMEMDYGM